MTYFSKLLALYGQDSIEITVPMRVTRPWPSVTDPMKIGFAWASETEFDVPCRIRDSSSDLLGKNKLHLSPTKLGFDGLSFYQSDLEIMIRTGQAKLRVLIHDGLESYPAPFNASHESSQNLCRSFT